jgi:hypothetical protein
MSRSTISTFQLFELFPDEESARVYLEGRLWPERLDSFIDNTSGKRLTYKGLIQ